MVQADDRAYARDMVRKVSLVVAVGFILGAALLVGSGSTATYAGEQQACAGPIVRAESNAAPVSAPSDRFSQGLDQACAQQDRRQLTLAGIAALLGLVAGSLALTSRPGTTEVVRVDALVN